MTIMTDHPNEKPLLQTKIENNINILSSADKKRRLQALSDLKSEINNGNHPEDSLKALIHTHYPSILSCVDDKAEACREQAISVLEDIVVKFVRFKQEPDKSLGSGDELVQVVGQNPKVPSSNGNSKKSDITIKKEDETFSRDFTNQLVYIARQKFTLDQAYESSEEVRLHLLQLLHCLLVHCNTSALISIYPDLLSILTSSLPDPYAEVKVLCAQLVSSIARGNARQFHQSGECLVAPLVANLAHRHSRVRCATVQAVGDAVLYGNNKSLNDVTGPLAERLFDQNPSVRSEVLEVATRWLLELPDRYSYFAKIIPLILTCLCDELPSIQVKAMDNWQRVGDQYYEENKSDVRLKDKMEFLSQELTHYPAGVPRPNLGCRVLVQREMSKFLPALQTELFHWLPQVRIKSAQLLCSLSQHEEHNIVQHIPSVLTMMYRACNDEESAVRDNVERAAEMIGYFVPPSVYCPLILPTLDEACTQGHITVLAAILKGGRVDEVAVEMDKIARFLSQPHICQNREAEYQSRLLSIVSTLLKSYPSLLNQQSSSTQQTNSTQQSSTTQQSSDTPAQSVVTQEPLDTQPSNQSDSQALNQEASVTQQLPVSQQSSITQSLFTLLITIRGLSSRPSELDSSHQLLGLLSQSAGFDSQADMFRELSASVLNACVTDVKDWCVSSPWRCVLDAILSYPNIRGGLSPSHMDTVVAIFTQVVQPDNDANLILKMLLLLCQCLDNPNSALASVLNLAPVINRIIQDILSVHLVWRAGRSQEALRTAAVAALRSCLCSMTSGTCYGSDSMSSGPNISGDSTTSQNPECPSSEGHIDSVALVSMTSEQSVSMFPGTLDTILPLLMACLEDGAVKTRLYSVDCVLLLVTRYRLKSNWSGDVFDKLYQVVLKRLDDENDTVREKALGLLSTLFLQGAPESYEHRLEPSLGLVYRTLLIHLDDQNPAFQQLVLESLKTLGALRPSILLKYIRVENFRDKDLAQELYRHFASAE